MKKSEKKKIAVGVCGTVFRSFLIFTVISCPFYGSLVKSSCCQLGSPSFSSYLRL